MALGMNTPEHRASSRLHSFVNRAVNVPPDPPGTVLKI